MELDLTPSQVVSLPPPETSLYIFNVIGKGNYGSVFKAHNFRSKKDVAVKVVKWNILDHEEIFREAFIMRTLKHPNVVSCHDWYYFKGQLWFEMDLCEVGSLSQLLWEQNRGLKEEHISYIAGEALKGIAYLHQKAIVHRDIKCDNIFITSKAEIKLGDFGISKMMLMSERTRTFIGTPYWMAPEVIATQENLKNDYSWQCDIWSFGISVIEMGDTKPPYFDYHPMRALALIVESEPPSFLTPKKWSKDLLNFVATCLMWDPIDRPEASSLLQHPFLRVKKSKTFAKGSNFAELIESVANTQREATLVPSSFLKDPEILENGQVIVDDDQIFFNENAPNLENPNSIFRNPLFEKDSHMIPVVEIEGAEDLRSPSNLEFLDGKDESGSDEEKKKDSTEQRTLKVVTASSDGASLRRTSGRVHGSNNSLARLLLKKPQQPFRRESRVSAENLRSSNLSLASKSNKNSSDNCALPGLASASGSSIKSALEVLSEKEPQELERERERERAKEGEKERLALPRSRRSSLIISEPTKRSTLMLHSPRRPSISHDVIARIFEENSPRRLAESTSKPSLEEEEEEEEEEDEEEKDDSTTRSQLSPTGEQANPPYSPITRDPSMPKVSNLLKSNSVYQVTDSLQASVLRLKESFPIEIQSMDIFLGELLLGSPSGLFHLNQETGKLLPLVENKSFSHLQVMEELGVLIAAGGRKTPEVKMYSLVELLKAIKAKEKPKDLNVFKMKETAGCRHLCFERIENQWYMVVALKKKVSLYLWAGFPFYRFMLVKKWKLEDKPLRTSIIKSEENITQICVQLPSRFLVIDLLEDSTLDLDFELPKKSLPVSVFSDQQMESFFAFSDCGFYVDGDSYIKLDPPFRWENAPTIVVPFDDFVVWIGPKSLQMYSKEHSTLKQAIIKEDFRKVTFLCLREDLLFFSAKMSNDSWTIFCLSL